MKTRKKMLDEIRKLIEDENYHEVVSAVDGFLSDVENEVIETIEYIIQCTEGFPPAQLEDLQDKLQ